MQLHRFFILIFQIFQLGVFDSRVGNNFGSKMLGVPKVVTKIIFDKKNFLKNRPKPGDPFWGQNFAPPNEISDSKIFKSGNFNGRREISTPEWVAGFRTFFQKKFFFFVESDPSDNFWHPKHFASKIFAHPNILALQTFKRVSTGSLERW